MSQMLTEALEAPGAVACQLEANAAILADLGARLRAEPPPFVVTCARGSSDHAATFGKYLIEVRTGLVTASAAPSVATVYGRSLAVRGALFLAISQSGRSPDLLALTERAREAGAVTVALVNVADSPLAGLCDHVVPLRAGPESSVAATKSYIASLSALLQLVASWQRDDALLAALGRLPDALEAATRLDWGEAVPALAEAGDLLVLGRGLTLGIAQEAALKLKETCGLHAEAFSAAEVMHGPVALVDPGDPVIVFSLADETRAGMEPVITSLAEKGARVFAAEPGPAAPGRLPVAPPLHPHLDPLPAILAFYRMAARLAEARGLDPDRPRHLRKVTETR